MLSAPDISFPQAARCYSALKTIVEGKKSEFMSRAILHQTHPISSAFQKIEAKCIKFLAGGNYYSPACFTEIKVDGQKVFKERNYNDFLDVEVLRSLAEPATFGRGTDTLHDETVRKALEIKADRMEIKYHKGFQSICEALQQIAPVGKTLVPKLYKMHIYETGGMFREHKDTIHAANHYATLIISVPSDFEGGEFVLTVDGEEVEFDLRSTRSSRYVVFFTDLPHKVLEVTSGVRAVLQYDVYLEDTPTTESEMVTQSESEDDDDDDDSMDYSYKSYFEKPKKVMLITDDFAEQMRQEGLQEILPLVDAFVEEHPREPVSFLLAHKYPLGMTVNNLKAGDRVLYDLLSRKYQVELGLAVNSTETDYDGSFQINEVNKLSVMSYNGRMAFNRFITMDENTLHTHPEAEDKNNNSQQEGFDDEVVVRTATTSSHLFFGSAACFSTTVSDPYIEDTGNEAAPGHYVYVSAVLSLGGPAVHETGSKC